jgi:hypothetical protein
VSGKTESDRRERMAKTRGAAGTAMTETPREGDSRPRHGDPLEEQVVDEQLAAARSATEVSAADRGAAEQIAADQITDPATQPIVAEDDPIAQRAYELYRARGGTHGADVDDWLQAERELRGERQAEDERGQADRGPSYEPDNPAHRPID